MSKRSNNQPPAIQQAVSVSTTKIVSGPLPSPEVLIQYNQAVSGAAERIIAMAEHDSAHLQTMEKMSMAAYYNERRLGQILGFSIGVLSITASVFLAMYGHEITASVIGGGTVVGLVSIFALGRLTTNSTTQPPQP